MKLHDWLNNNSITFIQEGNIYIIDNKRYLHVHHKFNDDEKPIIFDQEFKLIIDERESQEEVDFYLFKFGGKFYYTSKDDNQLNILKYLGSGENLSFPYLGIHGKFELLNGSRDYNDWCNKAKFLGYNTLGLCEKNTLAGILYFQKACETHGIKYIIGETLTISEGDYKFDIKLYVKNQFAWEDLLELHKQSLIENYSTKCIPQKDLKTLSFMNLEVVVTTDTDLSKLDLNIFKGCYYQLDITEFLNDRKDKERLLRVKDYFENYSNKLKPIIIQDSYYLDKEDANTKKVLNDIGNIGFQNLSEDQYFKSYEELFTTFCLKVNTEKYFNIVENGIENTIELGNNCNFKVVKTGMHLPKYKMNYEESLHHTSSESLFFHYIEEGLKKIEGKDTNVYMERLENEISILSEGNIIDYFLILRDIIQFIKSKNAIPGIGRGSAAGSLVSYLLGIVEVDPIEHGLIFERFLTLGRLKKGSLPDIDQDIPSAFRQQTITYIVDKYGINNVALIGTSAGLKLKSLLKDLLKIRGIQFKDANLYTSFISKDYDLATKKGLFELACKYPPLKKMVNEQKDLIDMIDLLIFQPRSVGIHAAGVVICPDEDSEGNKTTIYDYIPCRYDNGMNVTEWEKDHIEDMGFLKEDLLGLSQLDKLMRMINLIKENYNVDIDITKIPLDDPKVFKLFQNGLTEDIFQFGTEGLKEYCKYLKPDRIQDLIAANSLYRPGAMESDTHNDYVKIKHGELEAIHYPFLEEVTEHTFGLFIYQETVMLAYQKITQCSLEEADNFRKVISKYKPGKFDEAIEKYEKTFKEHYEALGVRNDIVDEVWDKIITFTSYSFNKSHAAAYSITGYITQWLKCYYPSEFYLTALEYADEKLIDRIIHEIAHNSSVTLKQPDVNYSIGYFLLNIDKNNIYWSLSSIKYIGEKIVQKIVEEREMRGKYYSLTEFIERNKGNGVNKRAIANMILCGAFDDIHNINNPIDRFDLLESYMHDEIREKIDLNLISKDYYWIIKQKELCGLGFLNYPKIYQNNKIDASYVSYEELQYEENVGRNVAVCGLIKEIIKRNTKNGEMAQILLDDNGNNIYITLFPDFWIENKHKLDSTKKILIFRGQIKYDSYKKVNVINNYQRSLIKML